MDSWKKRVGLFLGSFDPFHLGHRNAVMRALKKDLDEVWIIPAMQNPWKSEEPVDIVHRFWLAHYGIKGIKKAKVVTVIVGPREDGKYYSVDQLRKIKRCFDDNIGYWIIGGTDIIPEINNWKEGDWILGNFKTLEIDRPGYVKTRSGLNISSTQIRDYIKSNNWDKLKEFENDNIINYIKKNNLYK